VRIGGPSPRFFFAFATEMSMAARERPSTSNGHAIRGRFSEAILAGLARATDPQGRVTGRSLQAFVFNLLGKEAAESGETALTRQEPKFQLDEAHDIVFVDRGTPYDLTVTFPAGQPATLLLGDLVTAVPPVSLDATTALWRLQPGLYLVRSGGSSKVVELLGTGGTVNVTV
ncbi:MAG TPA: hypothetical protein VMZ66_04845, partial [Aeromicrobium sp.]|nr:hypothetical protein [Aeromicrobium sp.]